MKFQRNLRIKTGLQSEPMYVLYAKRQLQKMQLTGSGHSAQKNAEPLIWVPGPAVITVCREKPLRKILRRTASRTQITATDFNGAVVLKLLSADCIKEYTQTDF
jgi:hypothetical protein